ncbi:hypothetical protein ACFQ44_07275 [Levilactobacillus lanxiensis]|uniref:DUF1310 family protein n=1 Tax=Levilactobacillus lanxiensis TaxID=2799568 RepID=A0ABW4D6M1_9LACO|nr:hypothetical protein [Levilactobacillus lanxiensis]
MRKGLWLVIGVLIVGGLWGWVVVSDPSSAQGQAYAERTINRDLRAHRWSKIKTLTGNDQQLLRRLQQHPKITVTVQPDGDWPASWYMGSITGTEWHLLVKVHRQKIDPLGLVSRFRVTKMWRDN